MNRLRNKEGHINMLRFAPAFVPIPVRKRVRNKHINSTFNGDIISNRDTTNT